MENKRKNINRKFYFFVNLRKEGYTHHLFPQPTTRFCSPLPFLQPTTRFCNPRLVSAARHPFLQPTTNTHLSSVERRTDAADRLKISGEPTHEPYATCHTVSICAKMNCTSEYVRSMVIKVLTDSRICALAAHASAESKYIIGGAHHWCAACKMYAAPRTRWHDNCASTRRGCSL